MGVLGQRLKRFRLAKRMSVRDLAKSARVSVSYIYAIEAGSRGANLVKLEQISIALGVPLSSLWGEESL